MFYGKGHAWSLLPIVQRPAGWSGMQLPAPFSTGDLFKMTFFSRFLLQYGMDIVIEDGTAAVQARLGHQFLLDFFGATDRVACVEWLEPGCIREHGPRVMSGPLRLPGVLYQSEIQSIRRASCSPFARHAAAGVQTTAGESRGPRGGNRSRTGPDRAPGSILRAHPR